MSIRATLFLLASLLAAGAAHAFGAEGHMAVGKLGDKLIEGTAAAKQVQAILGPGEHLREAAIWPDCARGVVRSGNDFKYEPDPKYHDKNCAVFETTAGQQELVDYVARNWDNCEYAGERKACHKAFHFADIPLQLGRYATDSVGAGPQDIVHAINAAIAFLRDGSRTEPFRFGEGNQGRREALRLLAHLLGDVHQPLHVGAIYLTAQGRATNPNKSKVPVATSETQGGNLLFIGAQDNLHHQWDSISTGLGQEDLTGEAAGVHGSEGAIESWAAAWASESVLQARLAYKGLSFGPKKPAGQGNGWPLVFKDRPAYLKAERDLQREQVTRGGARLAEVLQAIWPD